MHVSKDSMWLVEDEIFWVDMGKWTRPYLSEVLFRTFVSLPGAVYLALVHFARAPAPEFLALFIFISSDAPPPSTARGRVSPELRHRGNNRGAPARPHPSHTAAFFSNSGK
jgi:hypothetical protein